MSDEKIAQKILAAYRAIERYDLSTTLTLAAEIETETANLPKESRIGHRGSLGGILIDLGNFTSNEAMIEKGTQYTEDRLAGEIKDEQRVSFLYNAGNGYSSLWKRRRSEAWQKGRIELSYQQSQKCFRAAIDLVEAQPNLIPSELKQQIYVNYANNLDMHHRSIEAIDYYDRALALNADMPEALGNKGMVLARLYLLMSGHRHQFLLEARRNLESALQFQLYPELEQHFYASLERVNKIIHSHRSFNAEELKQRQKGSPFLEFLSSFCIKYRLYLSPITFLGKQATEFHGDPMFINEMMTPIESGEKFERCITFLNQIKQDYTLARYLLVQSFYPSQTIDDIDEGVSLYYPLDYSLISSYIQILKTSLRLALDLLDKIAFFLFDYLGIQSMKDRDVNFRRLFADPNNPHKLRSEFIENKVSSIILSLFDLSRDLGRGGYFERIYEYRNALTHRFLVVHDFIGSDKSKDLPRIGLREFQKECLLGMQIARAAVMYLILFVDSQEFSTASQVRSPLITGLPLDEKLRWKPNGQIF